MRTVIYDNDGRQVLSQSIDSDLIKVDLIELDQLVISLKAGSGDTDNFMISSIDLLPIIEQLSLQIKSYNAEINVFTSDHFQAELQRLASRYVRDEEILNDEDSFKEHRNLIPQDHAADLIYKVLAKSSRLKNDIRSIERIKSAVASLQDEIKHKESQLEVELKLLTQSNPELFLEPTSTSIEANWAKFFGSVLGLKETNTVFDLDDLLQKMKPSMKRTQ